MRPQLLFPLFTSITTLTGVGAKGEKLLNSLCGDKIIDLIWHLPSGLVDRSYSPQLISARTGCICTLKVKVLEHIPPQTKKQPYRVVCTDGTDQVTISFFKVYADSIA